MKKLASIQDLPAEEAEAVSAAQKEAQAGAAGAGAGGPAQMPVVLPPVRRIRSHHHRHRRFRMEKLNEIRHREDIRALSFILPLILLVIGIGILGTWLRTPDPTLRPDKLLSIAWVMTAVGGGWLLVSASVGAFRNWQDARQRAQEERADADSDAEYRRGRRRHHHHHHHHHQVVGDSRSSASDGESGGGVEG